jgi:hypothetical protein
MIVFWHFSIAALYAFPALHNDIISQMLETIKRTSGWGGTKEIIGRFENAVRQPRTFRTFCKLLNPNA